MSESLDYELDNMQQIRRAYFMRMRSRAIRLEALGAIEPSNVDNTLEQLASEIRDEKFDGSVFKASQRFVNMGASCRHIVCVWFKRLFLGIWQTAWSPYQLVHAKKLSSGVYISRRQLTPILDQTRLFTNSPNISTTVRGSKFQGISEKAGLVQNRGELPTACLY